MVRWACRAAASADPDCAGDAMSSLNDYLTTGEIVLLAELSAAAKANSRERAKIMARARKRKQRERERNEGARP